MLGLSWGTMAVKQETGEFADILRWSQAAIDIADGDPTKADFFVMSPLALAVVFRGYARAVLGLPGWREDFDDGIAIAHEYDPLGFASSVAYKYGAAMQHGLFVIDDFAIREIEEALQVGLDFGDHDALGLTKYVLGCALLESRRDVGRGLQLLAEIREICERGSSSGLNFQSSTSSRVVKWHSMETPKLHYRRCARRSTGSSRTVSSHSVVGQPACWSLCS